MHEPVTSTDGSRGKYVDVTSWQLVLAPKAEERRIPDLTGGKSKSALMMGERAVCGANGPAPILSQ